RGELQAADVVLRRGRRQRVAHRVGADQPRADVVGRAGAAARVEARGLGVELVPAEHPPALALAEVLQHELHLDLGQHRHLHPLVESHGRGRRVAGVGDDPALFDVVDVPAVGGDVEHAGRELVDRDAGHRQQAEALLGGAVGVAPGLEDEAPAGLGGSATRRR
ncbi:MAG: hypothetical protein ACK559_01495, partial [bacterium]